MQINLKKLEEQGFEIHIDDKRGILDIYPRQQSEFFREHLMDLFKEVQIDEIYAYDVLETSHEYQVLSAIRRTR